MSMGLNSGITGCNEVIIQIMVFLVSESPKLMGNVMLSCKHFKTLACHLRIFKAANMSQMLLPPSFLQPYQCDFISKCFQANNLQARYIVGCHFLFMKGNRKEGIQILENAAVDGDFNSLYAVGVAKIMETKKEGFCMLKSILSQKNGIQMLRQARISLSQVVLGLQLDFQLERSCLLEGRGHWYRDMPCPYGEEDFHVCCLLCALDLNVHKLIHRLW